MKKLLQPLIALLLTSCLLCCKKESNTSVPEAPPWFLYSKQILFSGNVSDSTLLWKYGVFGFQKAAGIIRFGQQHRYLTFSLTSNADLTTRFEINTPAYDPNSNTLFSNILSKGLKEFGPETENFMMKLNLNNQTYTTNGNQSNSRLEVLKVETTKDEFDRDMALVWFKTDCKFYRTDGFFAFNLKEGYILVGFLYNL